MARQPTEPPASQTGVVVLGGGVAGISAALHLLEAGFPVTLVEARRFLGGRAFSFVDAATGEAVDNGQHVITAGCTRFLDLLQRLEARERWFLQERLDIPVRSRSGVVGALRTGPVPAPFHLLGSLLRYPHLGLRDKLVVLSALVRAKLIRRDEPGLEQTTFLPMAGRAAAVAAGRREVLERLPGAGAERQCCRRKRGDGPDVRAGSDAEGLPRPPT